MDQPLRNPPSPVAGTKPSARSGILPWLQLLHFGPSVFTTAAFGMYIALGAHGAVPTGRWALLLGAQLATQFAISLFNDYWDLPADRVTRPDKPIPAGVVSAARVRMLGVVAAALAVALAAPLGTRVLVCNVAGLAAGLLYDVRLKRTVASPLPFAVGFGVLPLWAWAGVDRPWDAAVGLGALLTAWLVLPLHLADTLPDLESDRAVGVLGLAQRLGRRATLALCWGALAGGLLVAGLLGTAGRADARVLGATLAAGGSLLVASIMLYAWRGPAMLRPMAGLIEAGALLTSLGWLAAMTLPTSP